MGVGRNLAEHISSLTQLSAVLKASRSKQAQSWSRCRCFFRQSSRILIQKLQGISCIQSKFVGRAAFCFMSGIAFLDSFCLHLLYECRR